MKINPIEDSGYVPSLGNPGAYYKDDSKERAGETMKQWGKSPYEIEGGSSCLGSVGSVIGGSSDWTGGPSLDDVTDWLF